MTEEIKEAGNLQPTYDRSTDFPQLIADIEGGVIANVLGLGFSNVALAVANSGKSGEITLKVKLKPASKTDPSILNVDASIAINEPKPNYGSKKEDFKYETVAYAAKGGRVTYERPDEDVRHQLNILPQGVNALHV